MRVAIVGAGIGGLSAAVGLQRAGTEVRVFERAEAVRAGGSGLSIFANGLAALDSLGLREPFEAVTDRRVAEFTAGQRTPDGTWVMRVPTESVGELRIVDRADLHRILLSALDESTVRTSAEVTSAGQDGTVTIRTPEGRETTETVDLVIGADGLRSRVRETVSGVVAPRYAGYSAWRGITAVPVDLGGEAGETIGRGRRFGIAPLADGRVYWFAVANMPEDAVFAEEKGTVEAMFAGWHSPIGALIAATEAGSIRRTPIADLSRALPSFHRGRVVLLGDAAHAMTPNLGQGGGQALEDAATLSALLAPLAARPDPSEAAIAEVLDRFERLRRGRSQSIAAASRRVGALFQLESRPLVAARNALLRLAPAGLMAAQAERVQEWDPPRG